MRNALMVMLAALSSPFQPVAETPPLRPLPGNPTCAYPAWALRNQVAGPVLFTAQVRPDGKVESVDIGQVPAKDLGFEEAVRTCVSKWRFEPTAGKGGPRSYEGRVRYRVAGTADAEVAIRVLLAAFASAWNAEKPDPEATFDALQGREPNRERASSGSPSRLAEQFKAERAAADWDIDLNPDFEEIRFLQPELAVVRQPFQRRTRSGVGSAGNGKSLLEATAIKRGESWALVGWYPIAGLPSSGQWLAPGIEELRKLKHVDPVFPDLALQSHVSALVILEAELDNRGHVKRVRVQRGHPLFDQAALEAVRQWEYEPPPFSGTPISVVKTVRITLTPDTLRERVSIQEQSWVTRGPTEEPAGVAESVPEKLPLPVRSDAEHQETLGSNEPHERSSTASPQADSYPPKRPASLKQASIPVGGDWLEKTPFYKAGRLGSVTHIRRRATTGELAIVGTGGAAFLPPGQGTPRIVGFYERVGFAQLLDRAVGQPRYLDRGGGGWQPGAFIREDGRRVWQPNADVGMDDLAAGDLDGDGEFEFVVGYNGRGGVRLLDVAGRQRWRADDANVWHVEIVDTDGDGKPEIVHSNAAGQVTVRDAEGYVLSRVKTEGYFSRFSLVQWPPHQTSILHAGDSVTQVIGFDGTVRVRLETPDTTVFSHAYGAAARLGGREYLALAVSTRFWDRTQVFVFDQEGVLRYREVVPSLCLAIAAPDADALLLGCGPQVLRYGVKAGDPTQP